jgi:large subunit ribosomal protein L4
MKLDITTFDGGSAGSVDLDEAIFGLEPRADILQRCVRWQLAKRRAGTHAVKNRADIARTGKKMYKQKGTGNARHGSARVPQFRGGGRAFGPQVRSHEHSLPKKVRALALKHALSTKARDATLIVVDEARMDAAKTKALKERFGSLGLSNALIIAGAQVDENFGRAARNLPNIDVLPVQGLNVYDILRREKLVLTCEAVDAINARFSASADSLETTL